MVRLELSLPTPGYTSENCSQARRSIEALGLSLPDGRIDSESDDARPEARPEARAVAALVLGLLRAGGQPLASALVDVGQGDASGVQIYSEELASVERAAELAISLLSAALAAQPLASMQGAVNRLLKEIRGRVIDPNALLLAAAARERGLPVMWLDQFPFEEKLDGRAQQSGLFKLGHGAAGRVLSGPLPRPNDPQQLEVLADRGQLLQQLTQFGFHVPAFLPDLSSVHSGNRAARAAARLDAPVRLCRILRPAFVYRHAGQASFGPLTDPDLVRSAFDLVANPSGSAWVEAAAPGCCYRFLVIGGRLQSVVERHPPEIVGDGKTGADELIRQAESKGSAIGPGLNLHDADVAMRLRLAGLDLESILPDGQRLALRSEGTPYNGGHCIDVTEQVSTEVRALAEAVAAQCGLNELAGIDLALIDLHGNAGPDNCTVLDVLPDPDLLSHASDLADARELTDFFKDQGLKNSAAALIDALFPPGQDGHIPLIAVTGTNGKTTTVRMIERILRQRYQQVACASSEGARIDDEVFRNGDSSAIYSAMQLLAEDHPDVAVLETVHRGLIVRGIAFHHCDVGVCLNVAEDHLGADGVETLDQLAQVKSEVVRRAAGAAVLNADDARVLAMRETTNAAEIVLVSQRADSPEIAAHCEQGGWAIVLENAGSQGEIFELSGPTRQLVMSVADIPATHGGAVAFNVENACFAIAAARAIGLSTDTVRVALSQFGQDCNPGRFNFFDGLHCQVLIDHAQNVPAMQKLSQAVAAMPCRGRRWLLLRALGNRRDEDIRALATAAALGPFDHYHCTNFDLLRGRESGEVPEMLENTLQAAGVAQSAIVSLASEEQAVDDLLARAGPEDLVVMLYLGDGHIRIWDKLQRQAAEQRAGDGAHGARGQVGHA